MKAQHRHELQTNYLADRLGKIVSTMRSGTRSNSSVLAWVFVVLAVAAYAIWQYSAIAGQNERSEQWMSLSGALRDLNSGDRSLANLADAPIGTIPGRTARFEYARKELQSGQTDLHSLAGQTEAVKKIQHAQKLYEELSQICVDSPLLTQEALMAIATAEESLVGIPDPDHSGKTYGDLDRALQYYNKLVKDFPDSPLGKDAARRVADIQANRAKVEEFYAKVNQLSGTKPKFDFEKDLKNP
jgi:predicted negative regulator of RcsB-dependent stress response